jgi:hypothetical protein
MVNLSDILARQFRELEESRRAMLNRAMSPIAEQLARQNNALSEVAQSVLSFRRIAEQIPQLEISSLGASMAHIAAHQPLSSMVRQLDAIRNIFPSEMDQPQLMALSTTLLSGVNQQLLESLRQSISESSSPTQLDSIAVSLHSASRLIDRQQVELLTKAMSSVSKLDISKLGTLAGSPVFAALRFTSPHSRTDQIAALASSFSGKLAASIAEALESLARDPNAFDAVKEMIGSQVSSLPPSRISAEGLWQIFIQILVLLIGLGQLDLVLHQIKEAGASSKEEREHFRELIEATQKIAAQTEGLVPKDDQSTYYIVERTARLQLRPSTKSTMLALLFPNQKVRLVETNHKWIYVEYFDYLEGVPKNGWVLKKYLKRSSRSPDAKRNLLMQRARGIWKDREDLPELRELRKEWDRIQPNH